MAIVPRSGAQIANKPSCPRRFGRMGSGRALSPKAPHVNDGGIVDPALPAA
jgi:hypothetical protein